MKRCDIMATKTPKYFSNAKGKDFSDTTLVGIRKKAIKELRNITKGGYFPFRSYSHHVQIFDSPNFTREHYIGHVGRDLFTEDDGKTIKNEYFDWYDSTKNKRSPLNLDGTVKKIAKRK